MPTKQEINVILKGGWTRQGVEAWWDRPRYELRGLTPNQAWELDPEKVYELAAAGRAMGGT